METQYKRTIAGSVGAGMGAIFNASGRSYYILEHKTESKYHHAGESQKIIVDQIELGRDSSCQVRFDESFETVSRRHAAIVKEGNDYKLIPLSQTNTTLINGQVVTGEWHLTSGDEIRLSSKGPLLGFIVPQGEQSLVNRIGFTERLNLFRKQALRPYKTALWILAIVLILAVAGLVTWNVLQGQKFEKDLELKQQQIEQVQGDLELSDKVIESLNEELVNAQNESAAERARVQHKLNAAKAERDALLENAAVLREELLTATEAAVQAGKNVDVAQSKIDALEEKLQKEAEKKAEEARKAEEKALKIYVEEEKAPVLNKKKESVLKKF